MDIETKVREIILKVMELPESDLDFSKSLTLDLGASSVELVEIVAALENEFDIEINDDDIADLRTIGDLIELLKKKRPVV